MPTTDLRPRAFRVCSTAPTEPAPASAGRPPTSRPERRSLPLQGRSRGDAIFHGLALLFAALVIAIAAVILGTLVVSSWPSITRFGLGFLTSHTWNTHGDNPDLGHYGALIFIFGTVYTSLLALLIAVPLSLGAAIFLAEVAPARLRGPASALVELLAAVPSVVYGLWGIFVLNGILANAVEPWLGRHLGIIPLFSGPPFGSGILAAGLILAVMIVPTIASISRDVLRAVPRDQREGMLALGATRWETITRVVIPYARAGIVGAIMLGLGRAVGETMAVTMVIGNGRYIGLSLFAITDTLASVIANQFTEATGTLYPAALLELGLLLFLITVILNALARLLVRTVARAPAMGRA